MTKSRFLNGAEASRQYGVLAGTYAASLMWADPLADAAAEALHAFHGSWWPMVEKALDEGVDKVPGAPPELAALIASLPPEPTAEQWAGMDAGSAAIARTGDSAGLVLQCVSLMTDYWSPPSTKPLTLTSAVTQGAVHPLAQTGAWWLELHKPGGLRRGADGFRKTLQVRLVHAFVRRVARGSGAWDRAAWGEPINQGDLFFQVVGFTKLMIDNLQRMGYRLSAAEKEGYFAFWRHAAAVLGLHKTYVAMITEDDTYRFWHLWMLTNPRPDAETQALARQTLETLAGAGGFRRSFLRAMVYWLLRGDVGHGLSVPWSQIYYPMLVLYPPFAWLSQALGGRSFRKFERAIASLSAGNAPERLEALARFKPAPPSST
ncbi:MAG: DUF2236 domain-containing protein [Reyranella sp.]|nr:MAG: DUF2236 domain-containing protein [Reyranella sp.]